MTGARASAPPSAVEVEGSVSPEAVERMVIALVVKYGHDGRIDLEDRDVIRTSPTARLVVYTHNQDGRNVTTLLVRTEDRLT